MKRLLMIQHYGGLGGSGVGLLNTIEALKGSYKITVYCPTVPNNLYNYYKEKGIEVKPISFCFPFLSYYNGGAPWYTRTFLKTWIYYFSAKKSFKLILKHENPDIVLINTIALSWMIRIFKECQIKAVCHMRETLPDRNSILGCLVRFNLNRFDGVMYISDFDKAYMHINNPKQIVIRDSTREHGLEIKKEDIRCTGKMLFVGGSNPIKGLDILLLSMKYIQSDVECIIAGEIEDDLLSNTKKISIHGNSDIYKYKKKIKKLLCDKQIRSSVKIIGNKEDITQLYIDCDVVIFPSKVPHQSRPVLEAGEYYKTAIVSDFECTREYVVNEYNGLCFEPGNPKDLAKKIDDLYSDIPRMHSMGVRNHDMVKSRQSFDIVKNELLKYVSLI